MGDLVDVVYEGAPNLAVCPLGKCEDRGEFMRCYFLYELCPTYSRHKNFMGIIKNMRNYGNLHK